MSRQMEEITRSIFIRSLTGESMLSMRVASYPDLVCFFPGLPNRCKVENRPGFKISECQFPGFKVQSLI
jgi:hypothetical protein